MVDVSYKIRSNKTGLLYLGYVQIGEKTTLQITDLARKTEIKKWIQNLLIIKGPKPSLVLHWAVPPNQQLVVLDFATAFTSVDLNHNLGVPIHQLNADELELMDYEVIFRPYPKGCTRLG